MTHKASRTSTSFQLSVNDEELFKFYQEHNLDFAHMNRLFHGILKGLMSDKDTPLNNSMAAQLLDNVQAISSRLDKMDGSILRNIQDRLDAQRKEYVHALESALSVNTTGQITPLIRDMNVALLDKTALLIGDIMPKNQALMTKYMDGNFNLLQATIAAETSKLLQESIGKSTIELFINNINHTIQKSHSELTKLISDADCRVDRHISANDQRLGEIQRQITDSNQAQERMNHKVGDVLKVFESVQSKATASEVATFNVLSSLFPSAEITHVGQQKETGDIMFSQQGRPKILIENKNHETSNVPKADVEKFIRDCGIQNCCGIMLAQNRGISNKQNFEFQVDNSNVLLYVHEVKFSAEKIKLAIDIVENLKLRIDDIAQRDQGHVIDRTTLECMHKDYTSYVSQKTMLVSLMREYADKFNSAINELRLPSIDAYLASHFASSAPRPLAEHDKTCQYCGKVVPKSMGQHNRHCEARRSALMKGESPGAETA